MLPGARDERDAVKEELVQATETDIAIGKIFVIKPCRWCSFNHRLIVTSSYPCDRVRSLGRESFYSPGTAYAVYPEPRCQLYPELGRRLDLTARQGRLFRVVDGLESGEKTAKRRTKESVK